MQKLKGLWIPAEILLDEKLTDKEKIILSMIIYLSDETGSCFASNQYIATIVKVTPNRVSKIISSLKNKKYIQVTESMAEERTRERELAPLMKIQDNYEKIILAMDPGLERDYNGIRVASLIEWLLDDGSVG